MNRDDHGDHEQAEFQKIVRITQLIASAMLAGTFLFAAIAIVYVAVAGRESDSQLISIVLAAGSLTNLIIVFAVPLVITQDKVRSQIQSVRGQLTPGQIPYETLKLTTIIVFGLLEASAFVNIVAYIIEQNWWSLAIAGVFVLFMISNFPTATRFQHAAETSGLSR